MLNFVFGNTSQLRRGRIIEHFTIRIVKSDDNAHVKYRFSCEGECLGGGGVELDVRKEKLDKL